MPFEMPDAEPVDAAPDTSTVDPHQVESLVNGFIAGKQAALFDAPDSYYRATGADAVTGAPAIVGQLNTLRQATLDSAGDDATRSALGPRLDAHLDDALDGVSRHVEAQRDVFARQTLSDRQGLIQRAATLEPDNDAKIAGLAAAQAGAAQQLAHLNGVEPGSPESEAIGNAARSQILRTAIDQRIASAKPQQAIDLYDKVKAALTPADRRALEVPIGAASDDARTNDWLSRESAKDGAPLAERAGVDDALSDTQRQILNAKIAARDSAAESSRIATVKGLDDQLAAATTAIATQPSQYRAGTLNALANAYVDAGAPEQADATRRLAGTEAVLIPFAQASVAAQQRQLSQISGPERTMAESIMNQQADAFAKDPYAAGTALYPSVGPALPEDDVPGRLQQARMIEAMRAAPPSTDSANVQPGTTSADGSNLPNPNRVWTDGQTPSQAPDQNLVPVVDGPEPTPPPTNDEPQGDDAELAQAQSKPSPSARPSPPRASGSKPAAPATPAKPLSRQEQAAANRKELDRLADRPASDYRSEESFPEDWEKRLPQATLDALTREASAFKVPRELLARIMWKESKFKERAGEKENNSGQGIAGITNEFAAQQLWDNWLAAAKHDPNNGPAWGELDMAARRVLGNMRLEPAPAIRMEAEYLRYLYDTYGHSWPAAVASYKHGPTVINAFLAGQKTAASMPNWGEVQAYLGKVFDGNAKRFDAYR